MFFEQSGWKLFRVADIEVSVSLWYVLLMVFIVALNPGIGGVLFAAAITISIVIHEFGHAIPSKLYKLHPSILLHGFGGLCMHKPADSDWKDILILLAGPIIEIIFGLLAFGLLFVTAGEVGYTTNWEVFLQYFAYVSVIWGLANLVLPLFPLDGGQLFHLFLRRFMPERKAQDIALKTSVTVAIPLGILAVVYGWFFGAIICFFIIMDNVNTLRSGARMIARPAKKRVSSFVKDTLSDAEAAFAEQDWREAARLCHVVRAGTDPIPDKQMDRIWEILGVATANQEEWEEALGWLKRAPDTDAVREARERCEAELESS